MKNISVKEWVEISGIIAIVGSLIFVGIEIQQNSAIARLEASQRASDQTIEIVMSIAENPELSRIASVVFSQESDMTNLSLQDGASAYFLVVGMFAMFQSGYDAVQEGIQPQSNLEGLGAGVLDNEFVRFNWPTIKPLLRDDFAQFIESRGILE